MDESRERTLVSYARMIPEIGGGEAAMLNATATISTIQEDRPSNRQLTLHDHLELIGPLACDIAICIMIGVVFLIMPAYLLQPYRRGFFCADETIRYPYKHSTVSTAELFIIMFSMLILTIVTTEVFRVVTLREPESIASVLLEKSTDLIIRFLTYFAHCFFGLLLTLAFTQITKWSVGRLRPHFIDLCKPNITLTPCHDPYVYITEYECQGGNESSIKEARLSFFSGHSSLSMATAIFCVIYMQARLPRRIYGITILPLLQAILISIALLIGLSRISDHMHHWSDVMVGFLVGCATGYYSAVILARVFERSDVKLQDERYINTEEAQQGNTTLPVAFTSQAVETLSAPRSAIQSSQQSTIVINDVHQNSI